MGGDTEIRELQEENARLRSCVAELESQLQQCETSKLQLKKSYEESLQTLADSEAKRETVDKELRLAHDQISSMWKELESLRKQVEGGPTHEVEPVACSNYSEVGDKLDISSTSSVINDSFLELQCTLCREKIKVQDLEAHSRVCASHSQSKTMSNSQSPKSMKKSASSSSANRTNVRSNPSSKKISPRNSAAISEEYLIVSVTRSSHGATDLTPFKVVTKTNMPTFSQPITEVYRSQGDFQWLYEALQEACPERIIPPLKPPISLDATMSEFQRFLSRISNHKTLRKQHHFIVFLTGTAEELRSLRAKHRPRRRGDKVQYKPAVGRDTNTGPLVATKDYLTTLEQNINGLVSHLEQAARRKAAAERTGHWFRAISESEPDETYLKTAAADLSRTCEATESQHSDSDETLFIHNLQSVADYVRAAQDLLTRVEEAVDRFLYWDEEVTIIEAVTSSPVVENAPAENSEDVVFDDSGVSDITSSSNHSNCDGHTQSGSHVTSQDSASNISEERISTGEKWAQASKHCADSKDYLEMMCRDMAEELAHFDLQKEKELKQVLLEYTAAQLERHEKFRGKWFAMQFLLDAPILAEKRAIQFSSVTSSPAAESAHQNVEGT